MICWKLKSPTVGACSDGTDDVVSRGQMAICKAVNLSGANPFQLFLIPKFTQQSLFHPCWQCLKRFASGNVGSYWRNGCQSTGLRPSSSCFFSLLFCGHSSKWMGFWRVLQAQERLCVSSVPPWPGESTSKMPSLHRRLPSGWVEQSSSLSDPWPLGVMLSQMRLSQVSPMVLVAT